MADVNPQLCVSCFRPIVAGRSREGKVTIGHVRGDAEELELPCGKCIGCRTDRARSWSTRIVNEASLYDRSVFVTLTYADAFLPRSLSLEYGDFQAFVRRLRKRLKGVTISPVGTRPIRFFVAGEYGRKYRRPHFHAILFNTHFPDSVQWVNGESHSPLAEELWGKGDVRLGEVTAESAAYVAGYTVEKQYGRPEAYEDVVETSTGELFSRRPEFCRMSNKPGVGYWWYQKFVGDSWRSLDASIGL